MSLRKQLLLVGGLILLLPVVVLRFAIALEESLRASQENGHMELTRFISNALKPGLSPLLNQQNPILLPPLKQHIILDGYDSDWFTVPWLETGPESQARVKAGISGNHLHILLKMEDTSVVYRRPGSRSQLFDQVNLTLHQEGGVQEFTIYSDGPGPVHLLPGSHWGLRGVWLDSLQGSLLELKVPLATTGGSSVSLSWLNINQTGEQLYTRKLHHILGTETNVRPLTYFSDSLTEQAKKLTPENTQLRIYNNTRQLLFEYDRDLQRDFVSSKHPWRALVRKLLTYSVHTTDNRDANDNTRQNSAYTRWNRSRRAQFATLTSFFPVYTLASRDTPVAWISLEKRTSHVAAVADDALFKVLTNVTLVILGVVIVLFGYASWLSWRIRSLKNQILTALNPEQRFKTGFRISVINDELGELSRGFSDMLSRLQNYSEYMESFASKLTHECRTPLAIVSSSLQLISTAENDQERQEYLERALTGAQRISALLTAMRQATQLEASIQQQDRKPVDLVPVLGELARAYEDMLPEHQIHFKKACDEAKILGNPDLIAQAIDKLVDNAKDFTPAEGRITLGVSSQSGMTRFWVENEGPGIPEEIMTTLFDPFISNRPQNTDQLHLGLGLVIVKLIADFHGATVSVENLQDTGVRFSLQILC